ncbi:Glucosylceramidase [Sarcoptes scabiei]|nr:Glucosylceramidase [Sarcoptes scabiei]
MIEAEIIAKIAQKTDVFFKHQQRNDPELNLDERKKIVEDLFRSDRFLFLSRYGQYLSSEQLNYHKNHEDEKVKTIAEHILRVKQSSSLSKSSIRNRRYQAMKQLLEDGDYFSPVEMQSRNPYLFEEMIGKYLDENERKDLEHSSYSKQYDRISFSSYLMEKNRQSQMKLIRLIESSKYHSSSESEDDENVNEDITKEEKELLKQEFLELMIQNFLNKGDKDFDYSQIDSNDNYDVDCLEFQRDQEDKYFDEEDSTKDDVEEQKVS